MNVICIAHDCGTSLMLRVLAGMVVLGCWLVFPYNAECV